MPLDKAQYLSDNWKDGIFNDRVVFCTGGAGTICSAQVRALVHLGANACIVGRNEEKTRRAAEDIATARGGAKVLGLGNVDVRDVESLEAAVARCVDELGSVDFVIAGAAGNFLSPISGLSPNAMKSVVDIDVLGSYNTLKATLPHLIASAARHRTTSASSSSSFTTAASPHTTRLPSSATARRSGPAGRILFISATIHYTTLPMQAHVSVAKAGVDALSHTVALEYGPRGMTSNVIAPGPIEGTEGMARLSRTENKHASVRNVPLGRWGSVKDIANGTVYLFSDTGDFVNGQILVIDGGAWRMAGGAVTSTFDYPDALLGEEPVQGVRGMKSSGSKL